MTDTETIKALECCKSYEYTCLNCPYCEEKHYTEENGFELMPNGKHYDDLSCDEWLKRDVFALVNRLQAEIERLKTEKHFAIQNLTEEIKRLQKGIVKNLDEFASEYDEKIKAEAVKEFAEKVQTEIKKALESNYKARAEKEKEEFNKYLDNLFWNYCTGKIDCLRGIDDFIDNLLKETVGDADGKRKEEIP